MIKTKIKRLKKASFFCLSLLSSTLPSTAQEAPSSLRDRVDQPVIGGNVRVPAQPESILDSLEKRVRLLFENDDTREDQGENPPVDPQGQSYRDTHSRMIEKYKDQIPGIEKHKLPPISEGRKPNLGTGAHEFFDSTQKLREQSEKREAELKKESEIAVEGASLIGKTLINNQVQDERAKDFFLGLLDKAKERALKLFN